MQRLSTFLLSSQGAVLSAVSHYLGRMICWHSSEKAVVPGGQHCSCWMQKGCGAELRRPVSQGLTFGQYLLRSQWACVLSLQSSTRTPPLLAVPGPQDSLSYIPSSGPPPCSR